MQARPLVIRFRVIRHGHPFARADRDRVPVVSAPSPDRGPLRHRPGKLGGPERTRTSDLRFRKPLLYPAELRDHKGFFTPKRLLLPFCYPTGLIIALANAASTRATASSCIPGITWL